MLSLSSPSLPFWKPLILRTVSIGHTALQPHMFRQ